MQMLAQTAVLVLVFVLQRLSLKVNCISYKKYKSGPLVRTFLFFLMINQLLAGGEKVVADNLFGRIANPTHGEIWPNGLINV